MWKFLHKITAILVSAFLLISMTFMGAWASSGTPSYTPPDDEHQWNMTGEGAGVSEGQPYYYHPDKPYSFGANTGVNAFVYDPEFSFVEKTKSINFDSVSDAINETAPENHPLVAYLKGGSGNYYIQWEVAKGTVDPTTGKFTSESTPATFAEEHLTNVPTDINGYREFTHSITNADNLQNNSMYMYTITAYNEDRSKQET